MKKLFAMFLCLVLLLPLVACAEESEGVLAYAEDFEDGEHDFRFMGDANEASKCVLELREEDGNRYLHCINSSGETGDNGFIQVVFGPELRNFDFSFRVRPYIKNPDYNWLKIVFRAYDEHKYGERSGGENESYLFNIWEWRGVLTIKSFLNRKSESQPVSENEDFWFDNGEWYDILVQARDTTITVFVNGDECVTMTDDADLRPDGIFGYCSWGANFDVDDIEIYSFDPVQEGT